MIGRNGQLQECDDPQPVVGGPMVAGAVPGSNWTSGAVSAGSSRVCQGLRRNAVEDVKAGSASGVGYSAQFG